MILVYFRTQRSIAESSCESLMSLDRQEVVDVRGKHRIQAELTRLEQETQFLEEELEEVEKMDNVSTICKELLLTVAVKPDPLLPVTNGPVNHVWDRWFEGPREWQGYSCSIL